MKKHSENTAFFLKGVKDGVPIALGYFAVSFSLGILARKAGLSPFQGFLASFLCNASAGEYAGFTLIGAGASYIEVALTTLIANARYFLMSCAESQRLAPDLKLRHRLLIGLISRTRSSAFPSRRRAVSIRFTPTAPWRSPFPAGRWAPCSASSRATFCPQGRSTRWAWRCTACFSPLSSRPPAKVRSLPA